MMKTINSIILGVCLCVIMGSCGSSVKNDPVEIAQAAVKCINKGDFKGIKKFCADSPFKALLDEFQKVNDNPSEVAEEDAEVIKNMVEAEYTLVEQDVDEENARIRFQQKSPEISSSIVILLENTDGKWAIESIR